MSSKFVRDWEAPPGSSPASAKAGLLLYNSLVDEKVSFVPSAGPDSTHITWYTCGPTVYDSAHMGHARNYVAFDILRRVLEDYFGYNVLYVMNVTDVDDKIILRARRNHLLSQYTAATSAASEIAAYGAAAVGEAHHKQAGKVAEIESQATALEAQLTTDPERKDLRAQREELVNALRGEQHKLARTSDALSALTALPPSASKEEVLEVCGDWVSEALDKEHGSQVSDSSIFRAHAAKYEREFLEDMDALGCRPATVMTRVSEYIPEVVSYVEVIVANGMAYDANGSVYFDTAKFRACGHTYGKLKPWAVGSALLAAEGEANFETSEKRSPMDFALWKASKPGEPSWPSPWGPGRPGWHIECSAMASSVLGAKMDIHSGGEDLRFPHHDNELAQAEAHYHHEGCRQWVNYFLHSGHLEIEGLKMSKSLKNFITIREALKSFSARQLRLMFVLQPWNKPMVYGEQTRGEMKAREAQLKHFFQNIEVEVRRAEASPDAPTRWQEAELELNRRLGAAQAGVHAALCDNINTMDAMNAVSDLIKAVNVYLAKQQELKQPTQPLLLLRCAAYVTKILSMFGLIPSAQDRPGWSEQAAGGAGSSAAESKQATAVLDSLAGFRDTVRALAKSKADAEAMAAAVSQGREALAALRQQPEASSSGRVAGYVSTLSSFCDEVAGMAGAEAREVLAACDRLRDVTLVDLGVRLEDRPDGKAVWKLDDPAALRAELAERAAQAADAARKKLEGALDRKVKELEKMQGLAALPPVEIALADKFSKFDGSTGEPTHDKDGVELEGKAKDKARKDWEKAKKAREPLTKKLAEEPDFMTSLQAEIATMQSQLAALTTNS